MDTTPAKLTDKRKQSLYFPTQMLNEIRGEAERLDRSLSWIIQRAWRIARAQMLLQPGAHGEAAPERQPMAAPAPTEP